MVKRKSKGFKPSPQILTASDDDSNPPKHARNCSTPTKDNLGWIFETPIMQNEYEDESSESSKSAVNGSNYEDFTSFLKSFSFVSGSEDEVEKQPSFGKIKNTSRNQSLSLNDTRFSQNGYYPQKMAYESSQSVLEMSSLGVRVITVPVRNLEIVSLQHPASITLHGYLEVSVLVGCISILGYTIDERKKDIRVFSSENTTLLQATTHTFTQLPNFNDIHTTLKSLINKNQTNELKDFLEHAGSRTVILVLHKLVPSASLQLLEVYFPSALQTHKIKKVKPTDYHQGLCSIQEDGAFTISSDYETIAEEIQNTFTKSISERGLGTRVIVHGSKRSGKSSLLRYLINKLLNEFPAVYYLDTDPGQTEFTPAGVVSLVKVTKPLLGPPYSHIRAAVRMIFTGSVTAETSPPMYIKSVLHLIEMFKTKFPKEMLLVNTMGWTQGVGGICFENISKALKPNILIDLEEETPKMSMKTLRSGTTRFKTLAVKSSPPTFSSKDLRNFSLMSYFGKCPDLCQEPIQLQAFRPVVVSWDKLAVYVVGKVVPPSRLIEAIHCSVVGLCRVDRSMILESENQEYPRTLFDEPLNECLGFGIVSATDETNHLLYIVTPLTVEELRPVNAIIKGNIQLPDVVYLKQEIPNLPLPYTDCSKTAPTPSRKMVRKRDHVSLKQITGM